MRYANIFMPACIFCGVNKTRLSDAGGFSCSDVEWDDVSLQSWMCDLCNRSIDNIEIGRFNLGLMRFLNRPCQIRWICIDQVEWSKKVCIIGKCQGKILSYFKIVLQLTHDKENFILLWFFLNTFQLCIKYHFYDKQFYPALYDIVIIFTVQLRLSGFFIIRVVQNIINYL